MQMQTGNSSDHVALPDRLRTDGCRENEREAGSAIDTVTGPTTRSPLRRTDTYTQELLHC